MPMEFLFLAYEIQISSQPVFEDRKKMTITPNQNRPSGQAFPLKSYDTKNQKTYPNEDTLLPYPTGNKTPKAAFSQKQPNG